MLRTEDPEVPGSYISRQALNFQTMAQQETRGRGDINGRIDRGDSGGKQPSRFRSINNSKQQWAATTLMQ